MTVEEKAREFLSYVERHHERLRKNLAKNVTYEEELFENTFQDAVLRVHDAILRNDPDISDFEKYFFMASRKWYMTLKNRRDLRRDREKRLVGTEGETMGIYTELQQASVDEVRQLIEAKFGKEDAALFLDYLGSKAMGRTSYSRYGEKLGIPAMTVRDVVNRIKKHLRNKYPNGLTSAKAVEETARILSEKKRRRIEDGLHREEETPGT